MSLEAPRFNFKDPSFIKTIGMGEKNVSLLRQVLDERLLSTLDSFPFSLPGTLEVPILRLPYQQGKVEIPNFPRSMNPQAIEKVMDNVIIARANFTGEYIYGPKIGTRGGEIGENFARSYKRISFPVTIDNSREYLVIKGMSLLHKADKKGKLSKQIEYVEYFVRPKDNGMDFIAT